MANIKRQVYLHVGPTNSVKTHQGIERLKQAENGIYHASGRRPHMKSLIPLGMNAVSQKIHSSVRFFTIEKYDILHHITKEVFDK